MERYSELLSIGTTNISPRNTREVGHDAWGILTGSESCYASSDASLFSSSLPVLPHEKCRCWYFLQILCAILLY